MIEHRHPRDVCHCGDARQSHKDGTGRCLLEDLCTPVPCQRFRLGRPARLRYRAREDRWYANIGEAGWVGRWRTARGALELSRSPGA